MAGRGTAPKDKAQRRNHHPPQRGEWVDLLPLEQPVLPELPKLQGGETWSPMTKATWKAWRQDPVTVMYSPADVSYALDTIRLYEAMTPSSASEVRLRMDGLGLTPKGKKDLRWRIKPGDGAASDDDQTRRRPAGRTDRRARLSVVT